MPRLLSAACGLALLASGPAVAAEPAKASDTRIFLIENSDGYGVDSCLANGEPCGTEVANAWCRTHDYGRALDFGRIAVTGSTGSASKPSSEAEQACTGPACKPVVAIACTR